MGAISRVGVYLPQINLEVRAYMMGVYLKEGGLNQISMVYLQTYKGIVFRTKALKIRHVGSR